MFRPHLVDPATHPALESLKQQIENARRLISHISVPTVDILTQSLGYSTLSITRHRVGGVINMVYFVQVQKTTSKEEPIQEWVLRVTNPWSRWRGCLPRNETTALGIVARWNASSNSAEHHIPIPKILSFSADATTSLIGCEYSLCEKLPGRNVVLAIPEMDAAKREILWKDFLRVQTALQLIPAELAFEGKTEAEVKEYSRTLGSFCRWPKAMGPILRDGPLIGPSRLESNLQLESLERTILDIAQSDTLSQSLEAGQIEDLTRRLKNVISKVRSGELDGERMWPTDEVPLALTHNDLHGGNMLVDPETGRLTGILDWDNATWGFSRDMANEWSCCLASDLFTDAALEEAKAEVERRWPSSLNMKLRSKWGALANTATWLTNYLSSWDGDPTDDFTLEPLLTTHKQWWRRCVRILDQLDAELALGPNAFTHVEDSDSDSEEEEKLDSDAKDDE